MEKVLENLYWDLVNSREVSGYINNVLENIQNEAENFSPTWHALGFVHCKLYENESGTLRIHIWPEWERDKSEQVHKIHDHIFSISSYVVCGSVTNKNYSLFESDASCESSFQLYRVKYESNGSSLAPCEEFFQPVVDQEKLVQKGNIYCIDRGVFHELSVNEFELTATFVATHNHDVKDPKMLGNRDNALNITRKKVNFPTHEWKALLKQIQTGEC
ncbi:hypothetical protein [Kushneria konosiri]|uniref:hypothetical protein n=1 Tax=Kushneria konosiri TaxID=698828 RepID=UPI001D131763|nr:hypothetical protein [Kushneria konosiri]